MALKDLSEIEQKIIGQILDRIAKLEQPVVVKVFSGGDEPDYINDGFVRAEVEKAIGVSDETAISVVDGAMTATVVLIHGNDEDVISDQLCNAAGFELMNGLFDIPDYMVEAPESDGLEYEDAISFTAAMAALKLPEEDEEFKKSGLTLEEYIADLDDERLCSEFTTFCDMIRAARAVVAREALA